MGADMQPGRTTREGADLVFTQSAMEMRRDLRSKATKNEKAYKSGPLRDACMALAKAHREAALVYDRAILAWREAKKDG